MSVLATSNRDNRMRHNRSYLATLAGAVLLAGCQDLAVTNPNRADRDRATKQATSVESFVSSSFRNWWPTAHDNYPSWALSTIANDVTSGFADYGQLEVSTEPRAGWNNSSVNARRNVNQLPWRDLYATISTVNDALIATDAGLVIVDEAQTARARAVAKFVQGISHGSLGMLYDQAFIVDEKLALDTVTAPAFHPYPAVLAASIAQLDEAAAIASTHSFTLPAASWLYMDMTSTEVARLANSFSARILASGARTRAEREAVDWNDVIRRIDAGIQTDFAPAAQTEVLEDNWKRLLARLRTVGRPSDYGRPSYWTLGPADSTDGFKNWAAKPVASRVAFQMRTRDRRIQGPLGPTDPGKYFVYNQNDIFAAARGSYRYSHYAFTRWGTGTSWTSGPQPALTVTEMDLLKAEALIRVGRAAEAVPLINKTRVANGQLPPVTVEGPPNEAGCVPRKLNGDCGSLWDALRYEKRIEVYGVDGTLAFFDARGWQTMPENSIIHFPVPGSELETLRLPNYTFGGPGAEGSAPAPDPEHCPVALARCS
jgi:hypothetical protein